MNVYSYSDLCLAEIVLNDIADIRSFPNIGKARADKIHLWARLIVRLEV
jgi:hypothetical protein